MLHFRFSAQNRTENPYFCSRMNQKVKVHLALILVALIYGSNYSIAKEVMPVYIKPFGLIVIRVVSAAIFFWILSTFIIKEKITGRADNIRSVACGVFGIAINQLFFFAGLNLTTPVNASLIMVVTPVVVLLAAAVLLKEKIKSIKVAGIAIAGLGAFLLISSSGKAVNTSGLLGDLFILLNAVSYGIYLVLVTPLMQRYQAITVVSRIFLVGAVLVLPFGFHQLLEPDWANLPGSIWAALVFMVFALTILAYLLNAWALRFASPSLLGVYIYLQPVLAILIAVMFGKDIFTIQKAIYALLIFAGVYLVSRNR